MFVMKTRGFAVLFLVVAGLFGPTPYTFDRVERDIAAQVEKSDRALDRAMHELPTISIAHKRALIACIDHHLACTRQDLVAAGYGALAAILATAGRRIPSPRRAVFHARTVIADLRSLSGGRTS